MTFVELVPHRRRLLVAGACLQLLGACAPSPTRTETDPRVCPQTYEFGNFGCTDVAGQVVGSAGQPLAGISVGPRYLPDRQGLNVYYVETDAQGRFQLRLTRFGAPPPAGGPDTLSLYIHAADPRTAGVNTPAAVRDSVLVRVTVAPVGAVPPVTEALVRLPTP